MKLRAGRVLGAELGERLNARLVRNEATRAVLAEIERQLGRRLDESDVVLAPSQDGTGELVPTPADQLVGLGIFRHAGGGVESAEYQFPEVLEVAGVRCSVPQSVVEDAIRGFALAHGQETDEEELERMSTEAKAGRDLINEICKSPELREALREMLTDRVEMRRALRGR